MRGGGVGGEFTSSPLLLHPPTPYSLHFSLYINMATLLLIDGHSQAYRAYFGMKAPLSTHTGELTGAVYGFTRKLLSVIKEYQPEYVAVAFDLARAAVCLASSAQCEPNTAPSRNTAFPSARTWISRVFSPGTRNSAACTCEARLRSCITCSDAGVG